MCNELYYANYDNSFKLLIFNILMDCNISEKYVSILTTNESIQLYKQAFIHHTIHPHCNYEYYEFKGDITINKAIIEYLSEIYPFLCCKEGVKVLSRLKILLTSKQSLSEIADNLDFWDYISSSNSVRQTKKKSLLEDVFEAFIGMTEYILCKYITKGSAYSICYNIIANQLKKNFHTMNLSYETLFDAKTRLKEICDYYKHRIGEIKYEYSKINKIQQVSIYYTLDGRRTLIGKGLSSLLIDAEQIASSEAILELKKMGIEKPIDKFYKKINKFSVKIS